MRKSDVSTPVIDKCKQLAEHWRMEIYEGCWLYIYSVPSKRLVQNKSDLQPYQRIIDDNMGFPIPSISDCLRKLRERQEFMPDYYNKKDFDRSLLNIFKNYINGKFTVSEVHYWLLSALLEVSP